MIKRNRNLPSCLPATVVALGFAAAWWTGAMFIPTVYRLSNEFPPLRCLHHPWVDRINECLRDDYGPGNRSLHGQWIHLRWNGQVGTFVESSEADHDESIDWYLIRDSDHNGTAYFAGYSTKSCACVCYMGRRGFCLEKPAPKDRFASPPTSSCEEFESEVVCADIISHMDGKEDRWEKGEEGWWEKDSIVYLLSGDQLLRVHRGSASVEVLHGAPGLVSIGQYRLPAKSRSSAIYSDPGYLERSLAGHSPLDDSFLLLRTEKEVLAFDACGRQMGRYSIPESLRTTSFDALPLDKTTAVVEVRQWLPLADIARHRFLRINNQGCVLEEETVDVPCQPSATIDSGFGVVAAPIPAYVTPAILFGTAHESFCWGESSSYSSALVPALVNTWPALLAVNLLGASLAWACYRRQHRYGQRWTWLWVGFVFLFGLPGWVGYRFHRRWPPLQPCPSCGKDAPRDREECCRCGEDFPSPALKGTEIFA